MKNNLTYFLIIILVFIGIFYIFFNNKLLEGTTNNDDSTPLTAAELQALADTAQIAEDEATETAATAVAEQAVADAEAATTAALLAQEEAHGQNRSGSIEYDRIRNALRLLPADASQNIIDNLTTIKQNWDDAAANAKVNVGDGQAVLPVNDNSKYKCLDSSPCYENQTPLYKCLPKKDITIENKIFKLHKCKNPDWEYDTKYEAAYDLKHNVDGRADEPGIKCKDRDNIQACEVAGYTCIPHTAQETIAGDQTLITYSENTTTVNDYIKNRWVRNENNDLYEGCHRAGGGCVIL